MIHCFAKFIFGLTMNQFRTARSRFLSDPHTDLFIDPYDRVSLGWLSRRLFQKFKKKAYSKIVANGSRSGLIAISPVVRRLEMNISLLRIASAEIR